MASGSPFVHRIAVPAIAAGGEFKETVRLRDYGIGSGERLDLKKFWMAITLGNSLCQMYVFADNRSIDSLAVVGDWRPNIGDNYVKLDPPVGVVNKVVIRIMNGGALPTLPNVIQLEGTPTLLRGDE